MAEIDWNTNSWAPYHPGIDKNPLGLHEAFPVLDRFVLAYLSSFATAGLRGGILTRAWIYLLDRTVSGLEPDPKAQVVPGAHRRVHGARRRSSTRSRSLSRPWAETFRWNWFLVAATTTALVVQAVESYETAVEKRIQAAWSATPVNRGWPRTPHRRSGAVTRHDVLCSRSTIALLCGRQLPLSLRSRLLLQLAGVDCAGGLELLQAGDARGLELKQLVLALEQSHEVKPRGESPSEHLEDVFESRYAAFVDGPEVGPAERGHEVGEEAEPVACRPLPSARRGIGRRRPARTAPTRSGSRRGRRRRRDAERRSRAGPGRRPRLCDHRRRRRPVASCAIVGLRQRQPARSPRRRRGRSAHRGGPVGARIRFRDLGEPGERKGGDVLHAQLGVLDRVEPGPEHVALVVDLVGDERVGVDAHDSDDRRVSTPNTNADPPTKVPTSKTETGRPTRSGARRGRARRPQSSVQTSRISRGTPGQISCTTEM